MPESVEAAREAAWSSEPLPSDELWDAWMEWAGKEVDMQPWHVGITAFRCGIASGRAEERNRLLNPSDELVEAVVKAIGGVLVTRGGTDEAARAALQAAGNALDSGSAG